MKNYTEFKARVEELAKHYDLTDDKINAIAIHGFRAFNTLSSDDLVEQIGESFKYILESINKLNLLLKVCPYTFKAYFEIMDAAIEEGVDIE